MDSKENLIEYQRESNWHIKSIGPQFKSERIYRRETEEVKQNNR